ncbi:hypothetical protein FACS1894166_07210 [Bacilli bacterium]|nr:hypothetical protein FACS1894166_07210 [Bacilli bacterium]
MFNKNKDKFLEYLKTIKGDKIIIHDNGKGADNVTVLLSLFKGLIPKALKFRFNPLKL